MPIDCVLSIRDSSGDYFINTYITVMSVLNRTDEKVRVHILHDETIVHGRAHLSGLCEKYGQEIFFHQVPDLGEKTAQTISSWFNIAAVYRYFAHEFISSSKAIYLDSDIIVNRDIKELYNVDLENHLFAAVLDQSNHWKNGRVKPKFRKKVEYLDLVQDKYFCSGVMLLNLDRLRKLSINGNILVEKTLQALKDGIDLHYPDQDILNALAAETDKGVLLLDESFNYCGGKMLSSSMSELEGKIVHYITKKSKPDKCFFPAHLLFWKYYALSPFAGDMIERMDKAYSSRLMDFTRLYLINTKQRRHALDMLQGGFLRVILKSIGRAFGSNK